MKQDQLIPFLRQKLVQLRLTGMEHALERVLSETAKRNLTVAEALDMLCDAEEQAKSERAIKRRIDNAKFPEVNTIDAFDFDHDTTRKKIKGRYLALHDMTFLERGINPLFLGKPGTGKTFLARALAYAACQAQKRVVVISAPKMLNELQGAELHGALDKAMRRYVSAQLLFIDDFAVLAMDPTQAKLAFQVISERYDYRRSTMITTNRAFKDWGKVFPDALNAQVIAERLTERSDRFVMNGKPYGNRGGGGSDD